MKTARFARFSLGVFVLIVLSSPLFAEVAKRSVTHEDIFLAKRIGGIAVSPDGQWTVVSVTNPDYDEKKQTSDLWLVANQGASAPRQLTFTKEVESGLSWSPTGLRLAFSTKRESDEAAQIYVLDLELGGEARKVTQISTGARHPQWSPDGKALLFVSNVYPDAKDDAANQKAASERKSRKFKARVYDSFPVRYWDKWLDELKPHLFVQPLDSQAEAKNLLAGTKLAASPGFAGRMSDTSEDLEAAWAPDGQSIVFAASINKDGSARAEVTTHLFSVAVTGGEPVALTHGDFEFGKPTFSADGKKLLALRSKRDGELYHLNEVVALTWPTVTEPTPVSPGLDLSVLQYETMSDSDTLIFNTEDQGLVRLVVVSLSGQSPPRKLPQRTGAHVSLSAAGISREPFIVTEYSTSVQPPDLRRVSLIDGTSQPLTQFNPDVTQQIDAAPVEEFWFTASNGRRIHNLVTFPPAYDPAKKYPLVTLIHGGPAAMSRDSFGLRWPPHLIAAGGYIVIQTNYTGSTGFGAAFAQAIKGDPFRGPAQEILEAVDEAIKRYPSIDADRLAAAGASYGGHLANWFQATSRRFKVLVSHAGLVNQGAQWGTSDVIYHRERMAGGPPWEKSPVWIDQSPIQYAHQFATPVLVTVGEKDFRVPINNTLEYWSALQRMQVPSRLIVFPDENHWIRNGENSRYHLTEIAAWLKKWLNEAPPSTRP